MNGGVGITLMGGDRAGPVCVSNDRVRVLENFQFMTGAGPCRDAFQTRQPVVAARMDDATCALWPMFAELAIESGIGAVFAYPLSSHGATVGVLTVYQANAGIPTAAQHDDGMALSEILGATLLSLQADVPEGEVGPALDEAVTYRAQIYQASGMAAVQLGVSAADALVRMRSHAFAHDMPLETVAADIVARRLRLSDDRPSKGR